MQSKQNYGIQYTNLWCVFLGPGKDYTYPELATYVQTGTYISFWIPILFYYFV